jgi:hypothetical protein
MEKIKFAAQVLPIMTVIPVLFIGTILGNDAHMRANSIKENTYTGYTTDGRAYAEARKKIAGIILNCGRPPKTCPKK